VVHPEHPVILVQVVHPVHLALPVHPELQDKTVKVVRVFIGIDIVILPLTQTQVHHILD
jgi:hypothetical protein